MYEIAMNRNVLDSLLLSDGSTGNGIIGTTQYVVNQQEMVAYCLISELIYLWKLPFKVTNIL